MRLLVLLCLFVLVELEIVVKVVVFFSILVRGVMGLGITDVRQVFACSSIVTVR